MRIDKIEIENFKLFDKVEFFSNKAEEEAKKD